ncbi:MAG: hypothetical protein IKA37_00525, partial [Spirochaetales bacterium]|nr:hypothetical protein [Spirochaetales bacterium]
KCSYCPYPVQLKQKEGTECSSAEKIMDFDMNNLKGIAMKSMGKDIVLLIIWGGIFGCLVGAAEAFLPL